MGRLVDADAVINVLKETGIIQDNDLGHLAVDEIDRIPTAYDMKKVIEKLEGLHYLVNTNRGLAVMMAIEIVRKGGVE